MYKQDISIEKFIIGLGLVVLTWLSTIYFGTPTASDALDPSWIQSLAYTFKHNFQAGVDYIFTFGPLGYFYNSHANYDVDLFYIFIAWHLITGLFLAVIFVTLAYKMESKIDKFIYLFLIVVVLSLLANDSRFFLGITASVILAISPPSFFINNKLRYTMLLGLVLLFLAVVSLTKFANFILAGVGVFSITVVVWHIYSHKVALIIPLAFTIFFLCIWLVSGQSLLNLPKFIINSLKMTSGYSDAMSVGFNITEIKLAIASIFIMVLMMLLGCFIKPWKFERFVIAGMVFFGIFLAWKTGFVRHDTHSLIFFNFAVLVPFFIQYNKNMPTFLRVTFRALRYIAIFTAISGLIVIGRTFNYTPNHFIAQWSPRIINNFTALVNLPDFKAEQDKILDKLKQEYHLPKISAQVGPATVDIFSWEQGVVFLNGLNWHPRPIFQSYAAYTPSLIAINGDFYTSDQAPEFVIFKLQTIDGQFPLMNDNEALKILLRDYQPLFSEKGYLLLKHTQRGQNSVTGETLLTQEIKIGELIDVRTLSHKKFLLSLDIRKSWLGHLTSLIYRFPILNLEIEASDGSKRSYRIIPGMTQSGFIINPLILSRDDLFQWYIDEETLKHVSTLRVVIKPEPLLEYFFNTNTLLNPNIVLKINEYQRIPYQVDDTIKQNLRMSLFHTFHSVPYKVLTPLKQEAIENGQQVLVVHAPGEMRFHVSPGKHTVTGQFGILKGMYSPETKFPTDGVEFSAIIQNKNGQESVLFKRFLNPRLLAQDRGLQNFIISSFETENNAELVLRTHPGAANNTNSDWSFWNAIKIDLLN
jgi:MFS family permease